MASQIIACPFCGQQFTVPAEQVSGYAGREVACSHCNKVFAVQSEGGFLKAAIPQASAMPPAPPQYAGGAQMGYAPPPANTTNGMAIAGLVCGIVGFVTCGLAGIAGLICSIIGLKKSNETGTGRGMAIAGIIVSALSMVTLLGLFFSIMLPSLARAREKANQVKCSSNLRQIGQAAMLYAQDNLRAGAPFGPNFQALVSTQMISTTTFDCPSDSSGGTGQLGSTKCSYIWLGANLKMSSSPNAVLAYEPLGNHGQEGCNVLFVDGHCEFLNRAAAQPIINDLEAGKNPPQSPPPFPLR